MIRRRLLLTGGPAGLAAVFGAAWLAAVPKAAESFGVTHSNAAWRKRLTPVQYAVLRQSDTERKFTSALLHEERPGTFTCAGCDRDLFASTTKFDSGTGWPSFWAPLKKTEECCRHDVGYLLRHAADGGALQSMRWPSRPSFRRRSRAGRSAVLHERWRDGIQARRGLTTENRRR